MISAPLRARAAVTTERIRALEAELAIERQRRADAIIEAMDAGGQYREVAEAFAVSQATVHRVLTAGG